MADTLVNIPGLTPVQGAELGDTMFEAPGSLGVVDEANLITLNLGPQHPSTHGVFRMVMQLQGETVISAIRTQPPGDGHCDDERQDERCVVPGQARPPTPLAHLSARERLSF